MAEIKLTNSNFMDEVMNAEVPVLVDFWAPWCGPCKMLGPVVAQLADELEGKVKVGKVNVDEEMELANRFQVASIPTVMVFHNGKLVKKSVGYRSKEELKEMLQV